jgi:hypothetical protein
MTVTTAGQQKIYISILWNRSVLSTSNHDISFPWYIESSEIFCLPICKANVEPPGCHPLIPSSHRVPNRVGCYAPTDFSHVGRAISLSLQDVPLNIHERMRSPLVTPSILLIEQPFSDTWISRWCPIVWSPRSSEPNPVCLDYDDVSKRTYNIVMSWSVLSC